MEARVRSLVRPFLPASEARPVVVEGEPRFALPELFGGHSHGQRFVAERADLCGLDLVVGTFARLNTGTLVLHLRSNPGTGEDIAVAEVRAAGLQDGSVYRFRFPPIPDSAGRSFYFVAAAPDSVPGDAVTFWARPATADSPSGRYEDGTPSSGNLIYRLVYRE
jgi:hypothetical protein